MMFVFYMGFLFIHFSFQNDTDIHWHFFLIFLKCYIFIFKYLMPLELMLVNAVSQGSIIVLICDVIRIINNIALC